MRRAVDEPVVAVEQQCLGRAAFVAQQRVERIDDLELGIHVAPAAASQRLFLHFFLRHPLEGTRLQHATLALHLAQRGRRHHAEPELPVERKSRHLFAGGCVVAHLEHGRYALATVTDAHRQLIRRARRVDGDHAFAHRGEDGTVVQFVGCDEQALWLERRGVRFAGIADAEAVGLHEQCGCASLVRGTIHARVELHDAPVEARGGTQVARRRVADHEPRDAKLLQQGQQHIGFRHLAAQRRSAVPVGAVGGQQVAGRGLLEATDRIRQRAIGRATVGGGRRRQCRKPLLRQLRSGAELVSGLQQASLLQALGETEVVGQRRAVPQVQFLQAHAAQDRRRTGMHEERVVDGDRHGQRQQPLRHTFRWAQVRHDGRRSRAGTFCRRPARSRARAPPPRPCAARHVRPRTRGRRRRRIHPA